jgi:methyl-accepting chemotaxis protein
MFNYKQSKKNVIDLSVHNLELLCKSNSLILEKDIKKITYLADVLENIVLHNINLEEVRSNNDKMEAFQDKIENAFIKAIDAFDNKSGWFVFDSKTIKGGHSFEFVEENGKYEKYPEYDIYKNSTNEAEWWSYAIKNSTHWSKPYYWESWNATIISYSKSVFIDDELIGVCGGELFFDHLKNHMANLKIYNEGYATLLNDEYDFLYHPDKNVLNLKTLDNGKYIWMANEIKNDKDDFGIINYDYKGDKKILAYNKLSNGFIFTINFKENELYKDYHKIRTYMILRTLIALILIYVIQKRLT